MSEDVAGTASRSGDLMGSASARTGGDRLGRAGAPSGPAIRRVPHARRRGPRRIAQRYSPGHVACRVRPPPPSHWLLPVLLALLRAYPRRRLLPRPRWATLGPSRDRQRQVFRIGGGGDGSASRSGRSTSPAAGRSHPTGGVRPTSGPRVPPGDLHGRDLRGGTYTITFIPTADSRGSLDPFTGRLSIGLQFWAKIDARNSTSGLAAVGLPDSAHRADPDQWGAPTSPAPTAPDIR